jgi:hypothetical protein
MHPDTTRIAQALRQKVKESYIELVGVPLEV